MIDPKGRPVVPWRLKLQRRKRGPTADRRVGMEMAKLVDDEGVHPDDAVFQIQKKLGRKGNGRSKCFEALKYEREMRGLAKLVDKASKPSSPE
jgi:hypothetical protein